MAETFKNFKGAMGTSAEVVYTCPAATTAIVLTIQVTNIDGVNEADASVSWTDSSDSGAESYLIKAAPIPAGSALGVLSGKLVLEAGDTVKAMASAAGDLIVSGSVLEMS